MAGPGRAGPEHPSWNRPPAQAASPLFSTIETRKIRRKPEAAPESKKAPLPQRLYHSQSASACTAADETFALGALTGQLACAANGFCLFAGALFGRLFIMATHLHFAEDTFALHLFLESAESLINIIIADEYLHVYSRIG